MAEVRGHPVESYSLIFRFFLYTLEDPDIVMLGDSGQVTGGHAFDRSLTLRVAWRDQCNLSEPFSCMQPSNLGHSLDRVYRAHERLLTATHVVAWHLLQSEMIRFLVLVIHLFKVGHYFSLGKLRGFHLRRLLRCFLKPACFTFSVTLLHVFLFNFFDRIRSSELFSHVFLETDILSADPSDHPCAGQFQGDRVLEFVK